MLQIGARKRLDELPLALAFRKKRDDWPRCEELRQGLVASAADPYNAIRLADRAPSCGRPHGIDGLNLTEPENSWRPYLCVSVKTEARGISQTLCLLSIGRPFTKTLRACVT